MPQITLDLDDSTLQRLGELAQRCNAEDKRRGGSSHGGDHNPETLLLMLAEDAAMVISRPGSWEGANMAAVLTSHGYEV